MKTMMKLLAGGAGLAALAAAVPADAQYYPYRYNSYSYSPYAYNAYTTQMAEQQCTAEVQNRLYTRTGLSGLIGSLFGTSGTSARVLSVTRAYPTRFYVRVQGLATTGRYAYNPYGYGYYGAVGAGYVPDLSFSCDVDYNGYVRGVSIRRR